MTNFVTLDLGRPLHVFDADTLAGGIHVRLSTAGEKLLALNGKEYTLDDDMTVIADDDGALALGGVIGGAPSGCTEATSNLFIEAALFAPARTAMTGRKLGIESDARYRFERGVDPAFVFDGMEVGTRLVLDMCGGAASELVVAGAEPAWQRSLVCVLRASATSGVSTCPETRAPASSSGWASASSSSRTACASPCHRGGATSRAKPISSRR